jgi:hypothetical protein
VSSFLELPTAPDEPRSSPVLTQAHVARHVRSRLPGLLLDDSGATPEGVAIYFLSDPRDVRTVRYVGQSRAPRRRLLQHIAAARLWLPHETPWWVKSPRLRPLYGWIRKMFQEEGRLPVMLVRAWVSAPQARDVERAHIFDCLQRQQPLLNFESELLQRQLLLL